MPAGVLTAVTAVVAIVAAAVALCLGHLTGDQFLAVLAGAGIHVSSVTIPRIPSGGNGGNTT